MSLRQILGFRVRQLLSQCRCLSLLLAMSSRVIMIQQQHDECTTIHGLLFPVYRYFNTATFTCNIIYPTNTKRRLCLGYIEDWTLL